MFVFCYFCLHFWDQLLQQIQLQQKTNYFFTIPLNSYCDQSHTADLSLNISNINASSSSVTLYLYNKDGSTLKLPGNSYNGVESTIIPGIPKEISGNNTEFYHLSFGGNGAECSERVYYGKLVSNTINSNLIAGGWVDSTRGNATIIINNGEPWNNSSPSTPDDECNLVKKGDDLVPTLSSNISCGVASASSVYNNAEPFYAFDDNTSYANGWHTAHGNTTGWLSYTFTSAKTVSKYTLPSQYENIVGLSRAPKDWKFEGWDGSKWVQLDERKNITDWQLNVKKTFDVTTNKGAYKQYRINITANNGNTEYIVIGEMEMLGE